MVSDLGVTLLGVTFKRGTPVLVAKMRLLVLCFMELRALNTLCSCCEAITSLPAMSSWNKTKKQNIIHYPNYDKWPCIFWHGPMKLVANLEERHNWLKMESSAKNKTKQKPLRCHTSHSKLVFPASETNLSVLLQRRSNHTNA